MLGLAGVRLEADMNRLLSCLFHLGALDEQFVQLQELQDESSPNFVYEVVTIYFRESEKQLRNLRSMLVGKESSDYGRMGVYLNQLMGSSSSIGAKRVRDACLAFRDASEHADWSRCRRSLQVLEQEHCYLRNKLNELFHMEQQRTIAAGIRYQPQMPQQ